MCRQLADVEIGKEPKAVKVRIRKLRKGSSDKQVQQDRCRRGQAEGILGLVSINN